MPEPFKNGMSVGAFKRFALMFIQSIVTHVPTENVIVQKTFIELHQRTSADMDLGYLAKRSSFITHHEGKFPHLGNAWPLVILITQQNIPS